jgi:hypothetical protein
MGKALNRRIFPLLRNLWGSLGAFPKNEPPREDLPSQVSARGGFLGGIRRREKGGLSAWKPGPALLPKPISKIIMQFVFASSIQMGGFLQNVNFCRIFSFAGKRLFGSLRKPKTGEDFGHESIPAIHTYSFYWRAARGHFLSGRRAFQANSRARCVAARTASMQAERKARSSRAASPAMVVPPGLVT